MTKEEAIKILKSMSDISTQGEAIDMAIEALHREEAEEKGYCHRINYIPKPCENANCDCVEVVYCKDCKHWQKTTIETIDGHPIYDCPFCGEWADANGFCSFGERREP